MQERIAQFGPDRGLVGILTLPEGIPSARTPHVVLLNSGIIHRVGSSRVHVDLARAFAAAGITVLRFDFSGVGDSKRRTDVESIRESVERDIGDAVQYLLESQNAERLVLLGLCSGAFDAFCAAQKQPHVVGAFMVDMPGPFRGVRHAMRHVASKFFRLSSWRNPLRSLLGHSRAIVQNRNGNGASNGVRYVVGARGALTRDRMQEQLDGLLNRGVRLHFTFTAGVETNYNHASQFRSTFPRAASHAGLSHDFFDVRDHSFSTREWRDRLVSQAVNWVRSS